MFILWLYTKLDWPHIPEAMELINEWMDGWMDREMAG
jgi:hypothetical protein